MQAVVSHIWPQLACAAGGALETQIVWSSHKIRDARMAASGVVAGQLPLKKIPTTVVDPKYIDEMYLRGYSGLAPLRPAYWQEFLNRWEGARRLYHEGSARLLAAQQPLPVGISDTQLLQCTQHAPNAPGHPSAPAADPLLVRARHHPPAHLWEAVRLWGLWQLLKEVVRLIIHNPATNDLFPSPPLTRLPTVWQVCRGILSTHPDKLYAADAVTSSSNSPRLLACVKCCACLPAMPRAMSCGIT